MEHKTWGGTMNGLKPCPFCGGEARMNHIDGIFRAGCNDIMCYGYVSPQMFEETSAFGYSTLENAVKRWNDRDGGFATENERLRSKIEELEYQIEDMQYEMMEMSER